MVSLIAGRAEHTRKKFSTLPLRRHAVKRYSQAGHNRKRKLESMAAPPELALHDFIRSKQNQATQQVRQIEFGHGSYLKVKIVDWRKHEQTEVERCRDCQEPSGGRAGQREDGGDDKLDPGLPTPRQSRHQARGPGSGGRDRVR